MLEKDLIEKLHAIEIKVSASLSSLETSHHDLKSSVDRMSNAVSYIDRKISTGEEKFSNIERRLNLVEISQSKNIDLDRARMWQVLSKIIGLAIVGGLIAWGIVKGG